MPTPNPYADLPRSEARPCLNCGHPFTPATRGPLPAYCGPACKKALYRSTKREQAGAADRRAWAQSILTGEGEGYPTPPRWPHLADAPLSPEEWARLEARRLLHPLRAVYAETGDVPEWLDAHEDDLALRLLRRYHADLLKTPGAEARPRLRPTEAEEQGHESVFDAAYHEGPGAGTVDLSRVGKHTSTRNSWRAVHREPAYDVGSTSGTDGGPAPWLSPFDFVTWRAKPPAAVRKALRDCP